MWDSKDAWIEICNYAYISVQHVTTAQGKINKFHKVHQYKDMLMLYCLQMCLCINKVYLY